MHMISCDAVPKGELHVHAGAKHMLTENISHLVYLYSRDSRGLTSVFSLPEGYKEKHGS